MNKKFVLYGVVVTLLLCVGMSYAYFSGTVGGNKKDITISSRDIRILFTDNNELSSSEIIPGWKETKTFSVKNESDEVFNYNIIFKDLINTFVTEGYLQYKITSSNGYNMTEYSDIPKSSTPEDIILAYDIDINPKDIHEYTIEFIYKDSPEDQSIDMGKEFNGTLYITEGTINPNIKYKVTLEMENGTITSLNPQETIKNGTLTYTYKLDKGYRLKDNEIVCDEGAVGSIEGEKVTISKITSSQTCRITTVKINYNLTMNITGGNIKPSNVMVAHGDSKEFTITASEGYTLNNPTITCTGGASHTLNGSTLIISNVKETQTCSVVLKEEIKTLVHQILADHPTRPGARPNLNSGIYQDENIGTLYTVNGNWTEGGKTVYYFSGNALDNWLYFAGLYWRIIRINEDSSVRLLYVGPDKDTTVGYINETTSVYNREDTNPNYVGYMYGIDGSLENNRTNTLDSTIKDVIDAWYNSKIKPSYNGYVSKTAIYCNDRANENYSTSNIFNYAASKRLVNASNPSYRCGNDINGNLYSGINGADIADKFTVSALTGNGKLTNPVALMTADEVVFAGGKYNNDALTYYYYNAAGGSVTGDKKWWTMSPSGYSYSNIVGDYKNHAHIYILSGSSGSGRLSSGVNISRATFSLTIRPVLSLKSCVDWKSGDGTSGNPYTVDSLDSACSSAEN